MIEQFSTLEEINNIENPSIGQQVFCEEDFKYYIYNENGTWEETKMEITGPTLSLYDLNKNIISQLPALTKKEIKKICKEVVEIYQTLTKNTYYMLLCKEYNYYTLFVNNGITTCATLQEDSLALTLKDILVELGDVYSVGITEDKTAIEIWCKPDGEEEPFVFYFFAYEQGVVYYD